MMSSLGEGSGVVVSVWMAGEVWWVGAAGDGCAARGCTAEVLTLHVNTLISMPATKNICNSL